MIIRTMKSGYWNGLGKWVRGYYTGGYYYTTYKVKVTLRKSVSGSNGMWLNGTYVKGKGRT